MPGYPYRGVLKLTRKTWEFSAVFSDPPRAA